MDRAPQTVAIFKKLLRLICHPLEAGDSEAGAKKFYFISNVNGGPLLGKIHRIRACREKKLGLHIRRHAKANGRASFRMINALLPRASNVWVSELNAQAFATDLNVQIWVCKHDFVTNVSL